LAAEATLAWEREMLEAWELLPEEVPLTPPWNVTSGSKPDVTGGEGKDQGVIFGANCNIYKISECLEWSCGRSPPGWLTSCLEVGHP
jgi:hypothetical protein